MQHPRPPATIRGGPPQFEYSILLENGGQLAIFEGEGWYFEIVQWWSGSGEDEVMSQRDAGDIFVAEPDWDELSEVHTVTGHFVWYDEDGVQIDEKYVQMEMDDGFYEDEMEAAVADAESYYEPA